MTDQARMGALPASLLCALAYADLFDYPLSAAELHRFQVGTHASEAQVERTLADDPQVGFRVRESDGYYALRGREANFGLRAQRYSVAARMWSRARLYGRWLSRLPYVRMLSVTGALAVDNVAERPDIDFMVVATRGRVWLCRRALILCVRVARLAGDELCPNYIISDANLELDQRDFFTAHELAQMVTLYGGAVNARLMQANAWAADYLPAAFKQNAAELERPIGRARMALEAVGSHPAFDRWERWELRRLERRISSHAGRGAEVVCTAHQCKGHTGLHRARVMSSFRERLAAFGLESQVPEVLLNDFEGMVA